MKVWESMLRLFDRQSRDITGTRANVDGTLVPFESGADVDAVTELAAGALTTAPSSLDESFVGDCFVLYSCSRLFADTNPVAVAMLGPRCNIRGPVFIVRRGDPSLGVYQSCSPDDIATLFPLPSKRRAPIVQATMDTSETVKEVTLPPPKEEPASDLDVVLGTAIEQFVMKEATTQERIVVDDEEDDHRLEKKRARRTRRVKRHDSDEEYTPRRSTRLRNRK